MRSTRSRWPMARLRARYVNIVGRGVLVGFFGLLVVLAVFVVSDDTTFGTGVGMLVLGLLMFARSLVVMEATVDGDRLTVRGIFRTRRWSLREVSHAEVAVGRIGMNPAQCAYLVIHLCDGSKRPFPDIATVATDVEREAFLKAWLPINSRRGWSAAAPSPAACP